jgi:hypothetical protein
VPTARGATTSWWVYLVLVMGEMWSSRWSGLGFARYLLLKIMSSGAGRFVPVPVAFWIALFRGDCYGLFVACGVCAVWTDGGDGG